GGACRMSVLPDPAQPLSEEAAGAAFDAIFEDAADKDAIGAFLLALAARGETAAEIAAAARALRARMVPVAAPAGAIDVCGTGGDGSHSLNVSTAVAFVVAGAGVPVAKHGNRGASSRSGTADVLIALGWEAEQTFERVEACLEEVGIAFLFAQRHHPAMAKVAPIRKALGVRTIFNLLGPLANPAGVRRQLVGVPAPRWAVPLADAALALGAEAVVMVHGSGLDEVAVHAESLLVRGEAGTGRGPLREEIIAPEMLGLARHPREAVAGGAPEENAAELRALFAGDGRPAYRDIVLANTAAALTLTGLAWEDAIAAARASLESGAAADRLARFLAFR
ncbi:MAG: anthranilate phosphoribosyltransferase, partial [Thermaurantiacus sp.]